MRLGVFFLLIAGLCAEINGQEWLSLTSAKGGFSISCPDSMQYTTQEFDTPLGAQQYHTYFHRLVEEEGEIILMISYVDYPEHSVHSDSTELVEDFFDQTVESAALSINGEVAYASRTSYRSYPSEIFKIFYKDGSNAMKSRIVLVKNRLYHIQVASSRSVSLNTNIDRFLNSFSLLE